MQHAAHFAYITEYANDVNDYNRTDAWIGTAEVHVQLTVGVFHFALLKKLFT